MFVLFLAWLTAGIVTVAAMLVDRPQMVYRVVALFIVFCLGYAGRVADEVAEARRNRP